METLNLTKEMNIAKSKISLMMRIYRRLLEEIKLEEVSMRMFIEHSSNGFIILETIDNLGQNNLSITIFPFEKLLSIIFKYNKDVQACFKFSII